MSPIMTERRVALVTCRQFAQLDHDDRLVIPALAALGVLAEPVVWDDPSVDWAAYDLAVVRSAWDYVDRRDDFLAWARSVPRLANSAAVLEWNTDKHYLRDLSAAGVPVVPTEWFEPGDDLGLPASGVHVIKPSIGAGARDVGRFDISDPSEQELARKHGERLLDRGATVMVQPYLDAVDNQGETALLHLGGRLSHAIRKSALLSGPDTEVSGLFREERITAREPSTTEAETAAAVLAAVPPELSAGLLYARVDLVPDADGRPALLELELSEPSLFLTYDPRAAARFAAAISARL
jgi:glutathione synthase/RimK-type ligase-like ATP-grasp enzyme